MLFLFNIINLVSAHYHHMASSTPCSTVHSVPTDIPSSDVPSTSGSPPTFPENPSGPTDGSGISPPSSPTFPEAGPTTPTNGSESTPGTPSTNVDISGSIVPIPFTNITVNGTGNITNITTPTPDYGRFLNTATFNTIDIFSILLLMSILL